MSHTKGHTGIHAGNIGLAPYIVAGLTAQQTLMREIMPSVLERLSISD